jgi:hypothetical protein
MKPLVQKEYFLSSQNCHNKSTHSQDILLLLLAAAVVVVVEARGEHEGRAVGSALAIVEENGAFEATFFLFF